MSTMIKRGLRNTECIFNTINYVPHQLLANSLSNKLRQQTGTIAESTYV